MLIEAIAAAGVLGTLACAALWRRERREGAARRQIYRQVLAALAAQDFGHAAALLEVVLHNPNATQEEAARRQIAAMQAHHLAQESARRDLEDVLSSLQDAVLVVDREARLRFVNQAALRLFEVRVEDILGAHLLEALPSFGLDSAVRAALQDGHSSERDVSLYAPHVRNIFLRVAPVHRGDGQVAGAVAILQDLTEMHRLERVRRDFVANASHELRAPIAAIRATAETVVDAADDPDAIARFLPPLVSEAERLSRLVNDLLDLAHAESRSEVQRSVVDLAAIAGEVVQRLESKAQQRHIRVHCDCGDEMLVPGDGGGLEQIVVNLLDNALIYTPEGGQVSLRLWRTDGSVTLAVSDNGIGIAPGDLSRIFERFYRVDKVRSRAQGGTGLGLAIVRHIVENHQGHIGVESEVGKGTTFSVTLPGT